MIKKIWDHFEEYLLIGMLAFSSCLVMLQVIMRYVFGNALTWSEELARFLFLWETWLGIAYATKRQSQLRITMIRDRLPGTSKRIVEIIVMIAWFCFSTFLVYKGFDMCARIAALGQRSTALRIPMQFIYAGIPVGATLMDIRLLEIFVPYVRDTFKKSQLKEGRINE